MTTLKTVPATLIVDDSEADIFFLRYVMKKTGRYPYVYEAQNGKEALDLFLDQERARALNPDKFPPTVVFLDINMPKMNGFEFLEELHKIKMPAGVEPSVIVMLSSSSRPIDQERSKGFPFVKGYITKPISEERALEVAERWGTN